MRRKLVLNVSEANLFLLQTETGLGTFGTKALTVNTCKCL